MLKDTNQTQYIVIIYSTNEATVLPGVAVQASFYHLGTNHVHIQIMYSSFGTTGSSGGIKTKQNKHKN